ncbi:hypothetical protein [Hoylesella marshii]|uniref:hypothetical protein n=1 Tax=Hoylesella marshii TaxID=189722 RepID=UPI0028D62B50|nr:hypothetical protein [Hoylesella marshii]
MKQIRIYYESLEQGANFIKPIVESVVKNNVEIVLVRRPKKAIYLNDGSIAALLTMTTPDALITGVYDDKEFPLVLIEFTEAVITEDHELQRAYGAIAAHLVGAYYLKVAGEKESEKEFGGAAYNPYSTPKIFIDKVGYEGYIIAKWETEKGNSYTLQRNKKFPSCPPYIAIFTDTIQQAVSAFVKTPTKWFLNSLSELKERVSYKQYRKMVDAASGAKELLDSWKSRRDTNLNKLRYFVLPKMIGVKINRFSHAMDPDRGILTFVSFLFSEKRTVLGIYALVRPRGNILMKQDMSTVIQMRDKLRTALEMDKGGLPDWLVSEFQKVAKRAKKLDDVFDFQPIWEKHKNKITENKVVMTLAYFLDGIRFNHNGITLVWDKRRLINTNCRDFIPLFAKHFGFTKYVKPTPIVEVNGDVDEDEVTYAIVHRVLVPNGFKIVSVSYPGSQGGGAVLPNPELGKAQPREYPDVIAMPPAGTNIDIVLSENKGMFTKAAVEKDVTKILRYKNKSIYKTAIKETLVVAQVINKHRQLKNIVVGVSFGLNKDLSWNPCNVDFVFVVRNRKQWSILYNSKMSKIIKKTEGQTRFPQVFKCDKTECL